MGVVALRGGVLYVGRVDGDAARFLFGRLVDLVVSHGHEGRELGFREHLNPPEA